MSRLQDLLDATAVETGTASIDLPSATHDRLVVWCEARQIDITEFLVAVIEDQLDALMQPTEPEVTSPAPAADPPKDAEADETETVEDEPPQDEAAEPTPPSSQVTIETMPKKEVKPF